MKLFCLLRHKLTSYHVNLDGWIVADCSRCGNRVVIERKGWNCG